ncbi:MAG TPA: FlgD immunoglobulin-like domain containing protein, partial [Candidatus Limnocylindrales bacterium]|nr:FlgD immunoglobulin-like domain containing protein [Candidatus Limnocylindrales bacterium]
MLLSRMAGGPSRMPWGIALPFILAAAAVITPASVAVSPARADSVPPKAVFIVGPTHDQTDGNLEDAEVMAQQAEAAGMDVRRVFFPYATWDNVLANIQGASMVVYMGHGYGWPSPYTTKLTEARQNGMGLNSFAGSGRAEYTYYGATPIKSNIHLATNAVVFNVHLCYAAGNAESGMALPSDDLARERVDNFANGWLAAGAGAVFAFSWGSHLNLPNQLMTSNQTMDQMFNIAANGSPMGHVGWRDLYYDSLRTPGARNHLDPHPSYGFYRAVSGNLNMTTAEFRAGALPDATPPPPPPGDPANPPQVTYLAPTVSQFHPNGDGLAEELVVNHVVSRSSYLDVAITNQAGETVRTYSIWATGTGASRWNGKDNAGTLVPDGSYT